MKEKTVCLNTEEISLKPIIRVENLTHTYGENTPSSNPAKAAEARTRRSISFSSRPMFFGPKAMSL